MAKKLPPGPVKEFVDTVRSYFMEGISSEKLWPLVARDLKSLLSENSLINQSKVWPDTKMGNAPPSNLLFYEDPDYGFVLNALVKAPKSITNIHDHGPSWTLYGVLDGGEKIRRFRRLDKNQKENGPAVLEPSGDFEVVPGYIDVVAPWEIHQESNGNHRTIGFIVRSQRSGTFKQFRYNAENGNVTSYSGPTQIPFDLN